ncbi:VTT domain-containing protein [Patescibacteria group bacterium]|nr:VTT domain-containing protein [Patescibacteria group bacterium]
MIKKHLPDIISIVLILVVIFLVAWNIPFDVIKAYILQNPVLGGLVFVFLMILSTVIPPITIFPLIPVLGMILGPFIVMVYSVVGWTIGSIISFVIARYLGRPFIAKYISLEKIDKWENRIPEKNEFLYLVFLRIISPVDILSYAVGLFCRISLWKYSIASFIGVIPFSFIFAYGYDILLFKDKRTLYIALIVVLIIIIGLINFKKINDKK